MFYWEGSEKTRLYIYFSDGSEPPFFWLVSKTNGRQGLENANAPSLKIKSV